MESQDWKIISILGLKLHLKESHGNPKKNSS
jgi:hypothetical protein